MNDDDGPISKTEIANEDDSSLTEEELSKQEKSDVLTLVQHTSGEPRNIHANANNDTREGC